MFPQPHDVLPVVRHAVAEVHQVVEIHRVVHRLLVVEVHLMGLIDPQGQFDVLGL